MAFKDAAHEERALCFFVILVLGRFPFLDDHREEVPIIRYKTLDVDFSRDVLKGDVLIRVTAL